MMPDADHFAGYYAMLELTPGSSPQQIHAQYRRLAKQYHPDRNPEHRDWAEEHLRRINEAYHALTHPDAPTAFSDPSEPATAPHYSSTPPQSRPHMGRRFLRYAAVVGLICGASVAYSNWSQSPQNVPPAAQAPAVQPDSSPAPSVDTSDTTAKDEDQDALMGAFARECQGVDGSVARASQIVDRVNAEAQHAPQSRRSQKAEQLAADTLELSRLQHSVRGGLGDLPLPTTSDLHRTKVADLRLALFQMQRQKRLVDAETASFPTK